MLTRYQFEVLTYIEKRNSIAMENHIRELADSLCISGTMVSKCLEEFTRTENGGNPVLNFTSRFVDSEGNILSDSIEGQDNEYFRNTLDDLLESLD